MLREEHIKKTPKFLIVEACFYKEISAFLYEGATDFLKQKGASYDRIAVPGALEIPAVIAFAEKYQTGYDGYIALGCVIRGETYHFDIVSNESNRGLMDLCLQYKIALGNGILTVENYQQALIRAKKTEKDKGGAAAAAAFEMFMIKKEFQNGGRG